MSDAGQLTEQEARYLLGHPLLKKALDDMLEAQIACIENTSLDKTNELVAVAALIQNRSAFKKALETHLYNNTISNRKTEEF